MDCRDAYIYALLLSSIFFSMHFLSCGLKANLGLRCQRQVALCLPMVIAKEGHEGRGAILLLVKIERLLRDLKLNL